jgi:hypothetical protein
MYAMDLAVTLIRKVPSMDNAARAPRPDNLTHASLRAATDGKVLTEVFYAAAADNSLAGDCDLIWYGGVLWDGPLGDLLGTSLNFSVQL